MKIYSTVNLVTEFDTEKIPASIALQMAMLSEAELKEILSATFVEACNRLGTIEEMNAGNQFAKVSFA